MVVPSYPWFCFSLCQLPEFINSLEADDPPSDVLSEDQ